MQYTQHMYHVGCVTHAYAVQKPKYDPSCVEVVLRSTAQIGLGCQKAMMHVLFIVYMISIY